MRGVNIEGVILRIFEIRKVFVSVSVLIVTCEAFINIFINKAKRYSSWK